MQSNYRLTLVDDEGIVLNFWSTENILDHDVFWEVAKDCGEDLGKAIIAALEREAAEEDRLIIQHTAESSNE